MKVVFLAVFSICACLAQGQKAPSTKQISHGNNSPNISHVRGNVTINYPCVVEISPPANSPSPISSASGLLSPWAIPGLDLNGHSILSTTPLPYGSSANDLLAMVTSSQSLSITQSAIAPAGLLSSWSYPGLDLNGHPILSTTPLPYGSSANDLLAMVTSSQSLSITQSAIAPAGLPVSWSYPGLDLNGHPILSTTPLPYGSSANDLQEAPDPASQAAKHSLPSPFQVR